MKSTERIVYIIIISILGLLVLAMGAYIIFDAVADFKEPEVVSNNQTRRYNRNDNQGNNYRREEKVVAKNNKFDYDGMQNKLLDYMNHVSSAHPYLSTCKLSTDSSKPFDETHRLLSKSAITKVFNKLKQASKVEEVKQNMVCPNYGFSVTENIYSSTTRSDLLNVIYVFNRDNKKSLLVAIDIENYASSSTTKYLYSYDNENELNNFLENLR